MTEKNIRKLKSRIKRCTLCNTEGNVYFKDAEDTYRSGKRSYLMLPGEYPGDLRVCPKNHARDLTDGQCV